MKKKLSLALAMLISLSCCAGLASCGSKGLDVSKLDVPTFEDTEGLSIASYAGPTVENWSGSQKNVNTLTDEHVKKLSEAGFNCMLALYEGARGGKGANAFETAKIQSQKAQHDALIALELAEKYNIKYYVRDWNFYGLVQQESTWNNFTTKEDYQRLIDQMFDPEVNQYMYSPAYGGNFGGDEPGVGEFERLAWQIEIYNAKMEELGLDGEFFLNMLPDYASTSHLGGTVSGGSPKTYTQYVDEYFKTLAPLLGYFSYDYYPFKADEKMGGSMFRQSYASNLEQIAYKCKEYRETTGEPMELRAFIQVGADFTGLRDLTSIGDFRLQMYTNLAFGARHLSYYEYGNFNSIEDGSFALLNLQTGEYNYTYDLAKKVNLEVRNFEDAYLSYEYDGVMCFSSLSASEINGKFRPVAHKLKSHPRIGNVTVKKAVKQGNLTLTNDALLTSFKNAEGDDAFMLVNFNDPYFNQNNTVTIEFKDAEALLMYRLGEEVIVPLGKNGKYTFELYPGEGRFIIPLRAK